MSGHGSIARALTAVLLAAFCLTAPTRAQESDAGVAVTLDGSSILGAWYRSVRPGGVRLTGDAHINFNGRQEWSQNAETCPESFDHDLETLDGAALYARLTEYNVLDDNDVPIAERLRGRLPDGPIPTLTSFCCCPGEINGSVTYALVAPQRLLAVAFGDGIYGLEDLQRTPPLVPAQALDQATREAIQRALLALGHYDDDIDGLFGPGTRTAIQAYQASLGDEESGILNRHQLDILLAN